MGVIVDSEGFVWRLKCTCPMHVEGRGQRGHDAKPIGNVIETPELAVRLGHVVRRREVA